MDFVFLRKPTWVLTGAWTVNALAYSIIYPFLPLYLHEVRGIPMATVGMIFPLMGGALIAAPPLAGAMVDRFGRVPMLQVGQLARGGLFLLLAAMAWCRAPFWHFAVVLTLNAGVGVSFQVASNALVNGIAGDKERPRVFSSIRIGNNLGWALGPMLGAFLLNMPFEGLFCATGLLCFLGAWYTGNFCHEPKCAGIPAAKPPAFASSLRQLRYQPELRRLFSAALPLFLLSSQLYSLLSVYATGVIKISANQLGLLYSLNGFAIILLQMPITGLLDRLHWSLSRRMVCGALLYSAGYFSLGLAGGWWMLAGCVLAITLGEAAAVPTLYAAVGRCSVSGQEGGCMALLELVRGVGYATGPWLGAIAYEHWASMPVLLWSVLAGLGLLAAAGFSFRKHENS